MQEDLRNPDELKVPVKNPKADELEMATALIEKMSVRWVPGQYRDEYRAKLQELIEARIPRRRRGAAASAEGRAAGARAGDKRPVDLVEALRKSLGGARTLQRAGKTAPASSRASAKKSPSRRNAATKRGAAASGGGKRKAAKRAGGARARRRAA
jgi:DNA end-binding protein Ku